MKGISLLVALACAGTPLFAQTIGMVEPPAGCHLEEITEGERYECMYTSDSDASNRIHLIFLEQVPTLEPGGARALAGIAAEETAGRIERVVASYAAAYEGLKGRSDPVEDVTGDHFMALYCGEGGAVIKVTSGVDLDFRVRECVFAPSLPGMMPRYGVIDTILYSEFFPVDRPATSARDDARRVFRSLSLTLPPVPFEATARDFRAECTGASFGEMCGRLGAEVLDYGKWIAPYWPLRVSRDAWLDCVDKLRRAGPSAWLDGFPKLTDDTEALPAQMVLFDIVLDRCNGAADRPRPGTMAAGPTRR